MKNEIEKILAEYTDGKETLQEATTKVLRLFNSSSEKELLLAFKEYWKNSNHQNIDKAINGFIKSNNSK